MHRWSVGHSRRKQGAQSTGSLTIACPSPREGGLSRIGGTEDRDDRNADGSSRVHGAGIVGQQNPAKRHQSHELPNRRPPGEIQNPGRRLRIASPSPRSLSAPKTTTPAPNSPARRAAASAKRSDPHFLARP